MSHSYINMSKIIPPMISSSPPPMDDTLEDDDEDDEFGSFSTANYSYNLDITQPSKISANVEWEGSVKRQYDFDNIHIVEEVKQSKTYNDVAHHNGTHSDIEALPKTFLTEEDEEVAEAFPREIKDVSSIHEMQQDNTSQDSVVSAATDSGLCSASQESDGTSPLPTTKGFMASLPASDNVSQDDSSSSEETLVKSTDTDPGVHFTSSSEVADDMTHHFNDNTSAKKVRVSSDLNSVDRRLQGSKQLKEENNEGQFPANMPVNQELTSTSMVNDFSDFSDYQTVKTDSESNASIRDSLVHSVKISADINVPNNASNKEQEKLRTNNTLNLVGLGCEIKIPDESRRQLSSNTLLSKGFDTSDIVECESKTAVNVSPYTGDPHESDDDFADFASSDVSLPISSLTPVIKSSESFGSNDEFADFTSCQVQTLTVTSSEFIIKQNTAFGSDDEFADFTSCEVQSSSVVTSVPVNKPNASFGSVDEFADFTSSEGTSLAVNFLALKNKANDCLESDDEFADFPCSAVPSFPSMTIKEDRGWVDESAVRLPAVTEDTNQLDDDFDDFDDFETASFSSTAVSTVADHSQLASRLENVVTTLFPGPTGDGLERSDAIELPNYHMVDRNPVWGDLRDVDTSHALSYQWGNSSANKMLLSALGIDTRNILFGAKWNVSVPRFAANLGISPLEPVRAHSPPTLQPHRESVPKSSSSTQPEASTSSGPEATVPDAQFDWTSSGLVNPLDYEEKDGHRTTPSSHGTINYGQQLLTPAGVGGRQGLSIEAVKVLESLPNLSFLRTKVLVVPAPGQALTH